MVAGPPHGAVVGGVEPAAGRYVRGGGVCYGETGIAWRYAVLIYVLVKFFQKEEYANDFIEGKLFANRLSYFKKLEGDEKRGDEDEGAVVFPLGNFTLNLTVLNEDTGEETILPAIGGPDVVTSPVMRPNWFNDINLFCMYALHGGGLQGNSVEDAQDLEGCLKISEACAEFGEYAVVVTNYKEFVKRVYEAAVGAKYGLMGKLVSYYDHENGTPPINSEIETIFAKRREYEYQSEYRFAIKTGTVGDNPIVLDIGKIDDITTIFRTSDLVTACLRLELT